MGCTDRDRSRRRTCLDCCTARRRHQGTSCCTMRPTTPANRCTSHHRSCHACTSTHVDKHKAGRSWDRTVARSDRYGRCLREVRPPRRLLHTSPGHTGTSPWPTDTCPGCYTSRWWQRFADIAFRSSLRRNPSGMLRTPRPSNTLCRTHGRKRRFPQCHNDRAHYKAGHSNPSCSQLGTRPRQKRASKHTRRRCDTLRYPSKVCSLHPGKVACTRFRSTHEHNLHTTAGQTSRCSCRDRFR